jgi:hypothetical protein
MAGAGKKTFVAGEVLTAQDVNDYLMDQSVMNFTSEAARSSAIPTPTTGMVSYVGDTGTESATNATIANVPQIQAYTGSTWQNTDGLTLLSTNTFTAVSSFQVNNVFTSTFHNYRIIFTQTACTGNDVTVNFKFVDGTTPTSGTGYYYGATGLTAGATLVNVNGSATTSVILARSHSTAGDISFFSMDVINPQRTFRSGFLWSSYNYNGAITFSYVGGGEWDFTEQFEGFNLATSSGTFSGIVSVYGYRRS